MADKMMRIAGRDPQGLAKAIKTDVNGNLSTVESGLALKHKMIYLGQKVEPISSLGLVTEADPHIFNGYCTEWYLNLTFVRTPIISDLEKMYIEIVYCNSATDWGGYNIVREVVPVRSFYTPIPGSQLSEGVFLPKRNPMAKYMKLRLIYQGATAFTISRVNIFEICPKGVE